ncbi:MAG: hypothetical protein F6K09_03235 [Merismopedia sp. SIO2A8]|nr:hypothetical protein [Symploca sp. SIO2B6]NET47737.1 hypothetical protein [Merismopedia sp. SIO2A8]
MSRHNNAKRDINYTGRDWKKSLNFVLNIKVLNSLAKLPLFKPIKVFFDKDILIKELKIALLEKDSEINRLKKDYSTKTDNLRYEYEKKQNELNAVIISLQTIIKQAHEQGTLNPAYLKIQEALNMLTSPNYHKSRKIHTNVALFLRENEDFWVKEAIREAQLKHSNLLNSESVKYIFSTNLHRYFNYLYESLMKGIDQDINIFVDSQSISSKFVYRTAFQYIKDKVQDQTLNIDEVDLLRRIIEHLIENNF